MGAAGGHEHATRRERLGSVPILKNAANLARVPNSHAVVIGQQSRLPGVRFPT